jgi:hypothetical protein
MKYVPAIELDNALLTRVNNIGQQRDYLANVAAGAESNARARLDSLLKAKKSLEAQRVKSNRKIAAWADTIATGNPAARQELVRLIEEETGRKQEIEAQLARLDGEITAARSSTIDTKTLAETLRDFSEAFDLATEQERKWLVKLIVHKVVYTPEEVQYALYPHPGDGELPPSGDGALELSSWLPKCTTQRTALLWFREAVRLTRGARGKRLVSISPMTT